MKARAPGIIGQCTMIPPALHVNGLEAEFNNTYKLLRLCTSGHSALNEAA
jgi:hypothetical protein